MVLLLLLLLFHSCFRNCVCSPWSKTNKWRLAWYTVRLHLLGVGNYILNPHLCRYPIAQFIEEHKDIQRCEKSKVKILRRLVEKMKKGEKGTLQYFVFMGTQKQASLVVYFIPRISVYKYVYAHGMIIKTFRLTVSTKSKNCGDGVGDNNNTRWWTFSTWYDDFVAGDPSLVFC